MTPKTPQRSVDEGGATSSTPQGPASPDEVNGSSDPIDLSRRLFMKVLGALGLSELAHHITFGLVPGPSSLVLGASESEDEHASVEATDAIQKVDEAAEKIIGEAEKHMEAGESPEKALMFAIDALGSANFFYGVRDLLPERIGAAKIPGSPAGHITSWQYAIMMGLTWLKYLASDEGGKHHLETETVAGLKAFGIISGTIVAAEGLQLDLDKAYALATGGKTPEPKDKVAIMTLLGSLVSPATTTVGSASLIRTMSNELAKTGNKIEDAEGKIVDEVDHDFAAVAVSHISNLSGYLLFGDPPFIAVCEKFGFREGVEWQAKTMWPLALASLASSTVKLNYALAKRDGHQGTEAWKKAVEDAFAGLAANAPVVLKIIGKSLVNVAKYFTAADLKWAQDPGGIQSQLGEMMFEKLKGMKDLFLNEEPPEHLHEEAHEGMVHDGGDSEKAVDEVLGKILGEISQATMSAPQGLSEAATESVEEGSHSRDRHQALLAAIEAKEFEEITRIGRELGIAHIEILVAQWKDFNDNQRLDESATQQERVQQTVWETMNPERIWQRATEVDRIKGYMGHNLGDVINVFPFQAGSVPFLLPMFKKGVDALEGLNPTVKEMAIFFAIMLFSMMADNYVACKIGLDLLPEKPQIALIAAIQGGSMTAIGNMANVAQFNLNDYPLAVSIAKMAWHADQVAIGLAWSQALGVINTMGVWTPPTPKAPTGHASIGGQQDRTRRGFFNLFLGGASEGPSATA